MSTELRNYFNSLGAWLKKAEVCLKKIVDHHGVPIAIVRKEITPEIVMHDFFYFCVTKSCKSLSAFNTLIEHGFPEDALIIVRSIYENYLSVAFMLNKPSQIDDLVSKRVGFSRGIFKHPISAKGKIDRRKLHFWVDDV